MRLQLLSQADLSTGGRISMRSSPRQPTGTAMISANMTLNASARLERVPLALFIW